MHQGKLVVPLLTTALILLPPVSDGGAGAGYHTREQQQQQQRNSNNNRRDCTLWVKITPYSYTDTTALSGGEVNNNVNSGSNVLFGW